LTACFQFPGSSEEEFSVETPTYEEPPLSDEIKSEGE